MSPAETTNRNQAEEHEGEPAHVDCGSAKMWKQEPANYATNDIASGQRYIDIEGLEFGEASSFEKDHRVTQDGVTAEDLSSPDDAVLNIGIIG